VVTAPNIAVFASGGGSNLQALIDANLRGDLLAPVALVVSNRSTSGALERARKHNIPWAHISSKTHPDPDSAILEQLAEHKIELIALAGYLKLISPKLIAHFTHKILNIHPGPLPRFGGHGMYGSHVHQAVLDSGVRVSGPCIFTVTKGLCSQNERSQYSLETTLKRLQREYCRPNMIYTGARSRRTSARIFMLHKKQPRSYLSRSRLKR